MAKKNKEVNATVTNAVVAGKRHGDTVQLSKERAERLKALGYVKDVKAVKKEPAKPSAKTKSPSKKEGSKAGTKTASKDKKLKTVDGKQASKKATKDDK